MMPYNLPGDELDNLEKVVKKQKQVNEYPFQHIYSLEHLMPNQDDTDRSENF